MLLALVSGETAPGAQYENGLTVLENGQTVIGSVHSPLTVIDPLATLNVIGNTTMKGNVKVNQGAVIVSGNMITTGGDIQAGAGNITVNNSPAHDFRTAGLWGTRAPKGTSCDKACDTGVCLTSYADKEEIKKLKCSSNYPNKNCLCVGRR